MSHPLEEEYGLTAEEILTAVNKRFRLKVALEGAVAEVRFERKLRELKDSGTVHRYEEHDLDDYPDFTVWPSEGGPELKVEVKNIRDSKEAYRERGRVVAYKVELQKTRRGEDPSSRYYDTDRFDVVAVCLGKKTGDWGQFFYAKTSDLERSPKYPNKLNVMHRVPVPAVADEREGGSPSMLPPDYGEWCEDLGELLATLREERDG